jgi:hypothetical protein
VSAVMNLQRISQLAGGLLGLHFVELVSSLVTPHEEVKCDNSMQFSLKCKKELYEVLLYSP